MNVACMKNLLHLTLVICAISIATSWAPSPKEHTFRLYIFEGSDWCHNCIRLDKNVLSKDQFKEFATSESIYIEHIDFPQRKKLEPQQAAHNAMIADKYGFKGIFPTLILVHAESNRQVVITYADEDVAEFIAKIELEKTQLF